MTYLPVSYPLLESIVTKREKLCERFREAFGTVHITKQGCVGEVPPDDFPAFCDFDVELIVVTYGYLVFGWFTCNRPYFNDVESGILQGLFQNLYHC